MLTLTLTKKQNKNSAVLHSFYAGNWFNFQSSLVAFW